MGVVRAIIFDLDGTLVDSSDGILASLSEAFTRSDAIPIHPLLPSLIGPPVREIVAYLAPGLQVSKIDQIVTAFKSHYDEIGYRATKAFPGVSSGLNSLKLAGLDLHIATNKRSVPTQSILTCLGWSDLFSSVYSSDSVESLSLSKANLLATQLRCEALSNDSTLYLGDRLEDWRAARANDLRFVWAQWGFSGKHLDFSDNSLVLQSSELLHLLPDVGGS